MSVWLPIQNSNARANILNVKKVNQVHPKGVMVHLIRGSANYLALKSSIVITTPWKGRSSFAGI